MNESIMCSKIRGGGGGVSQIPCIAACAWPTDTKTVSLLFGTTAALSELKCTKVE